MGAHTHTSTGAQGHGVEAPGKRPAWGWRSGIQGEAGRQEGRHWVVRLPVQGSRKGPGQALPTRQSGAAVGGRQEKSTDTEKHTAPLFNGTSPLERSVESNTERKKRKAQRISVDQPVKRTRVTHYCQHNHSMEGRRGRSRKQNQRNRVWGPWPLPRSDEGAGGESMKKWTRSFQEGEEQANVVRARHRPWLAG